MRERRVVIIGGGIAGLTTAYRTVEGARSAGMSLDVTVLEASGRVGGNIRTEEADGFTVEWGPNGFLDNVPSTLELSRDLGLEGELQPADPRAAKRFIWRNRKLHTLPAGPVSFVGSPVLSLRGRMRVLLEPFQPKGSVLDDESVRDFGVRRIGEEAADVLIDAMVSGIFAGDAAALSLPSAFPKMRAMEAQHGSLVKAMIARMRARRATGGEGGGPAGPGGTLTSFRRGMETLPRALAATLGPRVRTDVPVRGIAREEGADAWRVHLHDGETLVADEVVLATSAHAASEMVRDLEPELARDLSETPTAGLAVVALGFRDEDLAAAPDGFGFLAPRSERLRMLGCLRDSSIFPGRAPVGHVLLRVMIGGAHDPVAVDLEERDLLDTVLGELRMTLGLSGDPVLAKVIRHPLGIAQYNLGHGGRVERNERRLTGMPGLSLAGSAYHGVAMNACVERAATDAEALLGRLSEKQQVGISLGT